MDADEAVEFVVDALCEERAVVGVDPVDPNTVRVQLNGGTVLTVTVRVETPD